MTVNVILRDLKSIMKTNLWEQNINIFSMEKLSVEIRVTHRESSVTHGENII